jgi:hypothetical protein
MSTQKNLLVSLLLLVTDLNSEPASFTIAHYSPPLLSLFWDSQALVESQQRTSTTRSRGSSEPKYSRPGREAD